MLGIKLAEPEIPFLDKADFEDAICRQGGVDVEGIHPLAPRLKGRVKTGPKPIGGQEGGIFVKRSVGDMHWKWAVAREPMG